MESLAPVFVDGFVASTVNRCRAVQERAHLLEHADFSSPNPSLLTKVISRISVAVASELVRLRNLYSSDPSNVLRQLRILDNFIKELATHLRYVDGARTVNVPWSLPKPLEVLIARFIPKRTVMLRPQWKYNYTISIGDLGTSYRQQLKSILPAATLDTVFADFPPGFHIVSFPTIERQSALLHSDLAHELGHLIADEYLTQEPKDYVTVLSEQVRQHVTKENETGAVRPEPLFLSAEVAEQISEHIQTALLIRRRALEEMVSDMFACRLLGPAALFAFVAVALALPPDLLPVARFSYYPPWRMRLRAALGVLDKFSLLPSQNVDGHSSSCVNQIQQGAAPIITALQEMVTITSDSGAIDKEWLVKIAYGSVAEALPKAEEFVLEKHGGQFMTPKALYAEIYELTDRLIDHIPPNEILDAATPRAASIEAIFNAAWFYRIAFTPPSFVGEELSLKFLESVQILNRLTLKAVEYSHLRVDYDRWAQER